MDLITVFEKFPNQEACIAHLENARWGDTPVCPHCGSEHVARKKENKRIGRWNCHDCKSSFNVMSKTVFQKTKIPLQKWFLGISLVLSAKKVSLQPPVGSPPEHQATDRMVHEDANSQGYGR